MRIKHKKPEIVKLNPELVDFVVNSESTGQNDIVGNPTTNPYYQKIYYQKIASNSIEFQQIPSNSIKFPSRCPNNSITDYPLGSYIN